MFILKMKPHPITTSQCCSTANGKRSMSYVHFRSPSLTLMPPSARHSVCVICGNALRLPPELFFHFATFSIVALMRRLKMRQSRQNRGSWTPLQEHALLTHPGSSFCPSKSKGGPSLGLGPLNSSFPLLVLPRSPVPAPPIWRGPPINIRGIEI